MIGCGSEQPDKSTNAEPSDSKEIQGTWRFVSHLSNGHPSEDDVGCFQVFVGNKFGRTWNKVAAPDSIEPLIDFELDPHSLPKQIDVLMAGGRMEGIYNLNGDKLTLCYPSTGDQGRPTKLETVPGDGNVLYVLERVRN